MCGKSSTVFVRSAGELPVFTVRVKETVSLVAAGSEGDGSDGSDGSLLE